MVGFVLGWGYVIGVGMCYVIIGCGYLEGGLGGRMVIMFCGGGVSDGCGK